MKRLLSIVLFALISVNAFAQEEQVEKNKFDHKFGVYLGTTAGDQYMTDMYSISLEVDFSFLYNVTEDVAIGVSTGLVNLFERDNEFEPNMKNKALTLGAAARLYSDNDKFFLGGEFGYSYGLDEGGFYYNPQVGVVLSECSGVNVSYITVEDSRSFSAISLGYEFTF